MDNISEIVKNVIGKMSQKIPDTHYQLEQKWKDCLSDSMYEHTKLVGIKGEKLAVLIDSPARAYQMKIKKSSLLKKIQQDFPEIKDIDFRVGNV